MPLPVLEETLEETRWVEAERRRGRDGPGSKRAKAMRDLQDNAGFCAWVWLAVMVANYMYCGGEGWDARRCVHLARRTAVQEQMLHGHELRVARFLGVDTAVSPGDRGAGEEVQLKRARASGVLRPSAVAIVRQAAAAPRITPAQRPQRAVACARVGAPAARSSTCCARCTAASAVPSFTL